MIRVTVLTLLIVFGCSLQAIGQSPSPGAAPAAVEGELKLVVALFRHGVRAPLKQIDDDPTKKPHAKDPWPTSQWGVGNNWGYLTPHGVVLAKALGYDYAETYKKTLPSGFKAFFWADVAERTMATAHALRDGFSGAGVPATVAPSPGTKGPDPLFHPFEAHCGAPDQARLNKIAQAITANSQSWIDLRFGRQFAQLYGVLACTDPPNGSPLNRVTNNSAQPCAASTPGCSDPIKWQGQFPYANTASETFLLEYANQIQVGWGRVLEQPPQPDTEKILSMMALHEFYFDQTQRETYLAQIGASNLLQEISQTLNGIDAPCRRIPAGYQFAAFVGHDTNIASVASLLGLSWRFTNAPEGTQGLPDNDPLPAGALVFELWKEGSESFVRISYAAQDLREMRRLGEGLYPAFRVPVRCDQFTAEPNTCKIRLKTFTDAVASAISPEFLSRCDGNNPVCGPL